jgi:hypothetical protein
MAEWREEKRGELEPRADSRQQREESRAERREDM